MNDGRLIDANALAERISDCWFLTRHQQLISASAKLAAADAMCKLMAEVAKQPTVDAVPIVRCFECANRGDKRKCPMCFDESDGIDFYQVDNTDDDGFCHYGERKEDNHATD